MFLREVIEDTEPEIRSRKRNYLRQRDEVFRKQWSFVKLFSIRPRMVGEKHPLDGY